MSQPSPRPALSSFPEHDAPTPSKSVESGYEPALEPVEWSEPERGRGAEAASGRAVLGSGLVILAVLWVGYTAWSAGRALAGQPIGSPALAQWVAIAAGPLALLGLAWIMFGRTRRREAEKFTRSVVLMRHEAQSLEALLEVLNQRIDDSQSLLTRVGEGLMRLGDEATGRFDAITRELDSSSERLTRNGQALDRAAENARNDIGVLLADLPRAEATAQALAEQLRGIGAETSARTSELTEKVTELGASSRETDAQVADAAQRLVTHLTHIESAGAAAALRVGEAETSFSGALDSLLERTAATLDQIRSGVDAQAAAVAALVEQASAGLGRTGVEAADALGAGIGRADAKLESFSRRVMEQEQASHTMLTEIDRGLALIDQRFAELSAGGDERANHFLESLGRARAELDALAEQAGAQDSSIDALAHRTRALSEGIARLSADIGEGLTQAIGTAESGTSRLLQTAQAARPEVEWLRDAAVEASERIAASGAGIAEQEDRFAALLASLHDGVGDANAKLAAMTAAIGEAQGEASRLTAETAPALVAALLQVRETAAHAAERAREVIAEIIPESAGRLSEAARTALEAAIREGIEDRLRSVESVAARAVESARAASDRLSQQMINIGQSAAALEQHLHEREEEQRATDSEAFARRVSLLIDSMHSAAIDVGKILSDEIDDKAWDSYLKGNRGVFTRRAVRLLEGSETRAIRTHYEADAEFQSSVNRYVHDFEAMLRRVLAEREGGMMAVTLMSSDMGKLYAALAQAVDKRR